MDPQSLHIKTWKELFKGFEKVQSFVIFSHGTVVIFDESQNDKDNAISKAVDIMEVINENKIEDVNVLRFKGQGSNIRKLSKTPSNHMWMRL